MIFIKFILWGSQNRFRLIPNPSFMDFIDVFTFSHLEVKIAPLGNEKYGSEMDKFEVRILVFCMQEYFFHSGMSINSDM